ncbi:MAG: TrmH family RNA methyltransferase [Mycobacteriales bacterium]
MVGRPSGQAGRQAVRLAADPSVVTLDGLHCVKHAARFGAELELLVTTDREAVLRLAAALAPELADRVSVAVPVDPGLPGRLPGVRPGSELVGFARRPAAAAPPAGPTVLLDNPRNPGNVGAVVRVAAGFGAAVRSTGSIDPWHPAVVRAAAGLHFATSVERSGAVAGPLIAFDPTGEDLRGVELPDRAVLAFGAERHGLSAAVRDRADRLVAIPMRELVSSYNLATSVAVALYHWSLPGTGRTRIAKAGQAGP